MSSRSYHGNCSRGSPPGATDRARAHGHQGLIDLALGGTGIDIFDKVAVTEQFLRKEISRLGPWHQEVELRPGLTTRVWLEDSHPPHGEEWEEIDFYDPREALQHGILRVYPDGLAGRSVLDCACNCGGYLYAAKDIGAGRCVGFDVRDHWIRQAEFLREHRQGPSDNVSFVPSDLYELPHLKLEPFDITFFNGIFYHLPEPVGGLKIAADLTRELMVVNTQTWHGAPDGFMYVGPESTELVLSGTYGLKFAPTGPVALATILHWAGFPETRLMWQHDFGESGRMEMLASKRPGVLHSPPE